MSRISNKSVKELSYTLRLVDVEISTRMKALKNLKVFLNKKSSDPGFNYDDILKIWKGLYYCMYMSDKPLVQENLAENISCLIHELSSSSQKLLFFKVAMDTFAREWNGIDKFRIDKFMMLFTRVFRQCLFFLSRISWSQSEVKEASDILEKSIIKPFDDTNFVPLGLKTHLVDILLEELSKVGRENLPDSVLISFLYPFCKVLAVSNQYPYVNVVQTRIVHALMKQSELGVQYQEDLTEDEIEIESINEDQESDSDNVETIEEEENLVMDPRAGGINVQLPLLKPDYNKIANLFITVGSLPEVSERKREMLYKDVEKLMKMANGIYPFKPPQLPKMKSDKALIDSAVKRLENFMNQKISSFDITPDRKLKRGKKGKRTKKLQHEQKKKHRQLKYKKGLKKCKLTKTEVKNMGNSDSQMKLLLARKLESLGKSLIETTKNSNEILDFITSPKIIPKNVCEQSRYEKHDSKIKSADTQGIIVAKSKIKINKPHAKKLKTKAKSVTTLESETKLQPFQSIKKVEKIAKTSKSVKITTNDSPKERKKQIKSSKAVHKIKNVSEPQNIGMDNGANKELMISKDVDNDDKQKANSFKQIKPLKNILKEGSKAMKKCTENGKTRKRKYLENVSDEEPKLIKRALTSQTRLKDIAASGNPFDEPLKEGETEIFIVNKKLNSRQPKMKKINFIIKKTPNVNAKGKLLKINLRENKEYNYKHYKKVLKSSPGIPFSANKKPLNSALKSSPSPQVVKKSMLSQKKFIRKNILKQN